MTPGGVARAGEIDLDTLMAFAVTTDQARQSAVWAAVSQQGYGRAVTGGLVLVPSGGVLEALESDYEKMQSVGLVFGEFEDFAALMERCEDIQYRANLIGSESPA